MFRQVFFASAMLMAVLIAPQAASAVLLDTESDCLVDSTCCMVDDEISAQNAADIAMIRSLDSGVGLNPGLNPRVHDEIANDSVRKAVKKVTQMKDKVAKEEIR